MWLVTFSSQMASWTCFVLPLHGSIRLMCKLIIRVLYRPIPPQHSFPYWHCYKPVPRLFVATSLYKTVTTLEQGRHPALPFSPSHKLKTSSKQGQNRRLSFSPSHKLRSSLEDGLNPALHVILAADQSSDVVERWRKCEMTSGTFRFSTRPASLHLQQFLPESVVSPPVVSYTNILENLLML